MVQQIINIGSAPNDGTGDQLRISFDKCNGNFTELYSGVAANVPTGNTIQYLFNNSTTEPPLSGQVRFNQAVQASTTKLWVSQTTSSGINIKQFLSAATTGAKLILQDKNDNTNYVKFDVTGDPVDKTTYWEFTVAVTASGGTLPNAPVLAAVTAPIVVNAAPFDALAYNGIQINGSFDVSQQNGSTSVPSGYVVDGWSLFNNTTAVIYGAQSPNGSIVSGLPNCLVSGVTTAAPSLTTDSIVQLSMQIEGYRAMRLGYGAAGAQPMTLAFWTAHGRPGVYSVSIRQASGLRSYVATYSQNGANTWEYKTVTIPGDTAGTWAKDNTVGISVGFTIASAPNFTAPAANTWYAANYVAAPGQVNGVAATSDAFRITGVVVLPGIQAPSAARLPFIMRPYDQELTTAKRYWQLITPDIRVNAASAGSIYEYTYIFPTEMRAVPTATQVAAGTISGGTINSFLVTPITTKEARPTLIASASGDCYVNGATFSLNARL
jgi:hypothetical protein